MGKEETTEIIFTCIYLYVCMYVYVCMYIYIQYISLYVYNVACRLPPKRHIEHLVKYLWEFVRVCVCVCVCL
jgi:hypothetical protein